MTVKIQEGKYFITDAIEGKFIDSLSVPDENDDDNNSDDKNDDSDNHSYDYLHKIRLLLHCYTWGFRYWFC